MYEPSIHTRASADEENVAAQFVRARLEARALPRYPGTLPTTFAEGYRSQDIAIARWPEPIGGWKVTNALPPQAQQECGGERLLGPAFRSNVHRATPAATLDFPIFEGGFSGVEPEIVVRVGRDAPPDKTDWTPQEAHEMVGELCIGMEIISSPLPALTSFGLAAVVSDFGANFGIVVGTAVPDWRNVTNIRAQSYINEALVGSGAISLDGPLAAFAFTLATCARRNYPLRAGMAITTGTITGFHAIEPGQTCRLLFADLGELRCRAVKAQPLSLAR